MKKIMYIALLIILILLIIWTVASYLFHRLVATPAYSVVKKEKAYEIRSYEPYLTASVEVSGTYQETMNSGFRILADYIFGNNTKQTSIDMTAPVTEISSEKIDMTAPVSVKESEVLDMTAPVTVAENEVLDMTAPVIESTEGATRIVSFVLPFEYTLETIPMPNNPDVQISQQEARKVAALRFSWYASAKRIANKKQELLSLLEKDGITAVGALEYAGYNAPLSAPWLNRHEVMVEIN
jgi:hypothetical protein